MKKRFGTLALALVMACSLAIPAGAANATASGANRITIPEVVNGRNINIIPTNVAEILALRFVNANVSSGLSSSWTEDTEVRDVVPMFDEDGVPTAFSIELSTNGMDTGYVVISAYPDVQDYILEYADVAEPLYAELDLEDGDQIVYTSTLTYLKDDGSEILVGLGNEQVDRQDVVNDFQDIRDQEVFESQKTAIAQVLRQQSGVATMSSGGDNGRDIYGAIYDPILYIEAVYGNGEYYDAYEWKNALESYTEHRIMNSFDSKYPNVCCGPTAVTNLIETAGSYRSISAINNKSINTIYSTVENIGLNNGWFYSGGTYFSSMRSYMVTALSAFGVSVTSGNTYTGSTLTYNQIKQDINANRFCIIGVSGHETYGDHFVYPYAYTRFYNSNNDLYKSFVKVADGWSGAGRYIDMGTFVGKSNQWFYSVGF